MEIEISTRLEPSASYEVWHIVKGKRKYCIKYNADGKDFDWMTDEQLEQFENGQSIFNIAIEDSVRYYGYNPAYL